MFVFTQNEMLPKLHPLMPHHLSSLTLGPITKCSAVTLWESGNIAKIDLHTLPLYIMYSNFSYIIRQFYPYIQENKVTLPIGQIYVYTLNKIIGHTV